MPARTKDEQPLAEDTNMEDAPASAQPETNDEDVEEEEEEEEVEPQRVRIVSFTPGYQLPCDAFTDILFSCLVQQTLPLRLSSLMKVTPLETL